MLETIVAPATPYGESSIGVIRISGLRALEIVKTLTKAKVFKNRYAHYRKIYLDNDIIDDVIVTFYESPNTYTGEDLVEISCHGSVTIIKTIVNELVNLGCLMAEPGEFTKRAFLNGKFDLTQAEAVSDLIYSDSYSMHKIALNQMRGGFQNDLKVLREELLHFTSMIELELDFSEEDVEFANKNDLMELVDRVKTKVAELKDSFKHGNAIKNGIPVAIAGKPNSGKSSLLNLLLNEEKAIVSNIAGTTRDAIEDTIIIDGIKYRFVDTAGLRKTNDEIESKGIEITKSKISKASVLIYLFDINDITKDEIMNDLSEFKRDDLIMLLVRNKIDLKNQSDIKMESLLKSCKDFDINEILEISAIQKDYLKPLKAKLLSVNKAYENNGTIVTNLRHYNSLNEAELSLIDIKKGIENGITGDLLSIDLRKAIDSIGEITGQITNDEMLGNIFSNFCIGK